MDAERVMKADGKNGKYENDRRVVRGKGRQGPKGQKGRKGVSGDGQMGGTGKDCRFEDEDEPGSRRRILRRVRVVCKVARCKRISGRDGRPTSWRGWPLSRRP